MDLKNIFSLYSDETPIDYQLIDNSHGNDDFRNTIITEYNNIKIVIKIANNKFTTIDKVENIYHIINSLNETMYYHPSIILNRNNNVCEEVYYNNKSCVVYAEEYSKYKTAEQLGIVNCENKMIIYHNEAIKYIGLTSSLHLSESKYPGYLSIFETIYNDKDCDEVKETALICKQILDESDELKECFNKIWILFINNEKRLKTMINKLPISTFQSDMNTSNVLLDDSLSFKGMLDFNCSGTIPCIVYMFREFFINFNENVIDDDENNIFFNENINEIEFNTFIYNLKLASKYYKFSSIEIKTMGYLYRYLRPFWWNTVYILRKHKNDFCKIKKVLDWLYNELTRSIDFKAIINN